MKEVKFIDDNSFVRKIDYIKTVNGRKVIPVFVRSKRIKRRVSTSSLYKHYRVRRSPYYDYLDPYYKDNYLRYRCYADYLKLNQFIVFW